VPSRIDKSGNIHFFNFIPFKYIKKRDFLLTLNYNLIGVIAATIFVNSINSSIIPEEGVQFHINESVA